MVAKEAEVIGWNDTRETADCDGSVPSCKDILNFNLQQSISTFDQVEYAFRWSAATPTPSPNLYICHVQYSIGYPADTDEPLSDRGRAEQEIQVLQQGYFWRAAEGTLYCSHRTNAR